MDWVAIFTLLLVLATFVLVLDARKGRQEQERQRKEIAFRAALNELTHDIVHLRQWNPALNQKPHEIWLDHRLEFTQLNKLLESVWIDRKLWERITG